MRRFKYVGTILLIIILLVLSSCTPQDANNLGDMYVNNIYPNPTNTYSLGSSTYQWNVGYFKSIYLNGSLLTPNGGGGVPSGGTAGQILTKIDSTDYNTQWVTFFGVNEDSNSNTSAGQDALQSNTTGNYNSAFGQGALQINTTGNNNSAFGLNALVNNTTGNNNSAFGLAALQSNTTGNYNSAFGLNALVNNTTGSLNSALGVAALQSNTTGNNNSAFGQAALQSNTTGNYNLALGLNAGLYNTTVSNQLFINTLDQGNYTNDVSNSLIYGIFNTTPASQTLSLNAGIINMAYLPTSSGGAAGSLWIDTTDGYVIKVNH